MTFEVIENVKYYLNNSFYTVGNNATNAADGITNISYTGEITIYEKIQGKDVLEISKYAFQSCLITRVTIIAKLRSINEHAFDFCTELLYLNIPSTVTFIGFDTIYLGTTSGKTVDKMMIVEFNPGRKQILYIGSYSFCRRSLFMIIYPSRFRPICHSTVFYETPNVTICSPYSISFNSRQSTTNMSKCPYPLFAANRLIAYSCNCRRRQSNVLLISFIISFLARRSESIIAHSFFKDE